MMRFKFLNTNIELLEKRPVISTTSTIIGPLQVWLVLNLVGNKTWYCTLIVRGPGIDNGYTIARFESESLPSLSEKDKNLIQDEIIKTQQLVLLHYDKLIKIRNEIYEFVK